jgi:threonine/homoserine/homoserine lactone efflux protein
MIDLWMILAPILVADVLNPVLFAFLVYAAGTRQGALNSSSALLGHTLSYLAAGVILALGLERIADQLANPSTLDFVVELIIGLFVVWVAVRMGKGGASDQPDTPSELTPIKSFGIGAILNLIGLPFAVPYVGAVSQILKVNLEPWGAFWSLAVYNLLYALPFVAVPLLVLALGDRSRPILERINGFLTRVADSVLPPVIGLVGLGLIADAVAYFVTGRPLVGP